MEGDSADGLSVLQRVHGHKQAFWFVALQNTHTHTQLRLRVMSLPVLVPLAADDLNLRCMCTFEGCSFPALVWGRVRDITGPMGHLTQTEVVVLLLPRYCGIRNLGSRLAEPLCSCSRCRTYRSVSDGVDLRVETDKAHEPLGADRGLVWRMDCSAPC